jgi:hypothetical protein
LPYHTKSGCKVSRLCAAVAACDAKGMSEAWHSLMLTDGRVLTPSQYEDKRSKVVGACIVALNKNVLINPSLTDPTLLPDDSLVLLCAAIPAIKQVAKWGGSRCKFLLLRYEALLCFHTFMCEMEQLRGAKRNALRRVKQSFSRVTEAPLVDANASGGALLDIAAGIAALDDWAGWEKGAPLSWLFQAVGAVLANRAPLLRRLVGGGVRPDAHIRALQKIAGLSGSHACLKRLITEHPIDATFVRDKSDPILVAVNAYPIAHEALSSIFVAPLMAIIRGYLLFD